jgi:hypothetical protein
MAQFQKQKAPATTMVLWSVRGLFCHYFRGYIAAALIIIDEQLTFL